MVESTIMKWIPRTKTFDSSVPPNDEGEFECWDFRPSRKREELIQKLREILPPEKGEEEENEAPSKLKRKQSRKLKEKSQRNLLADLDEDENFSLDMYSRICKGETFKSIFKQTFETGDMATLRRLNKMSEELHNLEKNIKEAIVMKKKKQRD